MLIYSDEDFIDISNIRSNPVLKPYWSPDLLLSTEYIGRLCMLHKDAVSAAGNFEENLEADGEYDLLLRIAEKTKRFHHYLECSTIAASTRQSPSTNNRNIKLY